MGCMLWRVPCLIKAPADLSDAEALSIAVLIKQPSMRNIPERWRAREAAYAYLIQ